MLVVNDVRKSFDRKLISGGYTTFKTQIVQALRPSKYKEAIARKRLEVLKGISFDVKRGETLGVIGRNGAGKSTLLKLLTGIYKPTTGTVERRGRVSALLELGAGFHPEFSGRENIYMNGMLLGLSRKELKKREEEIIAFSEIEEFIDAPVRTYSSGMYMRLAFSIAVNVDPDILIIDEILAVGDEHFAHKSREKLDEFKRKNVAIVLVTHSLPTVETWCTKALWLDEGVAAAYGDPSTVCNRYRAKVSERENQARLSAAEATPAPVPDTTPAQASTAEPNRWGDQRVTIRSIRVLDAHGKPSLVLPSQASFSIEVQFDAKEALPGIHFAVGLWSSDNHCYFGANSQMFNVAPVPVNAGPGRVVCTFKEIALNARNVRLDFAIETMVGAPLDHWRDVARLDFVSERARGVGSSDVRVAWDIDVGAASRATG